MEVETQTFVGENATKEVNPPSMEWLISFKNPSNLWSDNWICLVLEAVIISLFLYTCHHAKIRGPRSWCLVVSCFLASIGLEFLQQIPHSGYQLWWYHQGVINLLQKRVPLYAVCAMTMLYYYVDYMYRNLNLPDLTQSFVKAVTCTLMLFPCLVLAPNYLVMMMHFDDPVFKDRILNVPYTQLTYVLLLFFHMSHFFNSRFSLIKENDAQIFRYIMCGIHSGVVTAIYSLVELYLLYIPAKHVFTINAAYILVGAFVILCCLAKDEVIENNISGVNLSGLSKTFKTKEFTCLCAFFVMLLLLPHFARPENLRSTGERLELGPCNAYHRISNMSPLDSPRRRYICTSDSDKFGYDFHCLKPSELYSSGVKKEYTLCGTPVKSDVMSALGWYSVVCLGLLYVALSSSITPHTKAGTLVDGKKDI